MSDDKNSSIYIGAYEAIENTTIQGYCERLHMAKGNQIIVTKENFTNTIDSVFFEAENSQGEKMRGWRSFPFLHKFRMIGWQHHNKLNQKV